jgi:hypothetical protein
MTRKTFLKHKKVIFFCDEDNSPAWHGIDTPIFSTMRKTKGRDKKTLCYTSEKITNNKHEMGKDTLTQCICTHVNRRCVQSDSECVNHITPSSSHYAEIQTPMSGVHFSILLR